MSDLLAEHGKCPASVTIAGKTYFCLRDYVHGSTHGHAFDGRILAMWEQDVPPPLPPEPPIATVVRDHEDEVYRRNRRGDWTNLVTDQDISWQRLLLRAPLTVLAPGEVIGG